MAMTARDHNNLLGIFFMIKGGLLILVGLLMGLIYAGVGAVMMGASHRGEEQFAGGAVMVFGLFIGLLIGAIGIFDLFTGVKVRKGAAIGRIFGIIVSVMSLFSFPLGTALGVYGLWFFFGDMGKALYLGHSEAPGSYDPPPPPPNSWQ
jgi:hypothetical protein